MSVRRAAVSLGVHKDTVFRWRHRVLRSLDLMERPKLRDHVAVDQIAFHYSRKGQRRGSSDAICDDWSRDGQGKRVWIVMLRDRHGGYVNALVGTQRPGAAAIADLVKDNITPESVLIGGRGRYSPVAIGAQRCGMGYRHPHPKSWIGPPLEPSRTRLSRFQRWLWQFRGVASRYLTRYAAWFHALQPPANESLPVVPWSAVGLRRPRSP